MTDVRVTASFEVVAESIVVGNGNSLSEQRQRRRGEIKRGRRTRNNESRVGTNFVTPTQMREVGERDFGVN